MGVSMNRWLVRSNTWYGEIHASGPVLSYERIEDAWKVASRLNRHSWNGAYYTIEDRG